MIKESVELQDPRYQFWIPETRFRQKNYINKKKKKKKSKYINEKKKKKKKKRYVCIVKIYVLFLFLFFLCKNNDIIQSR